MLLEAEAVKEYLKRLIETTDVSKNTAKFNLVGFMNLQKNSLGLWNQDPDYPTDPDYIKNLNHAISVLNIFKSEIQIQINTEMAHKKADVSDKDEKLTEILDYHTSDDTMAKVSNALDTLENYLQSNEDTITLSRHFPSVLKKPWNTVIRWMGQCVFLKSKRRGVASNLTMAEFKKAKEPMGTQNLTINIADHKLKKTCAASVLITRRERVVFERYHNVSCPNFFHALNVIALCSLIMHTIKLLVIGSIS